MKLITFLEIIFHILLLGFVFPFLISSNRYDLFGLGVLGGCAYVFINLNRLIKKFKENEK